MKVLLVAIGTRGDVKPMAVLGQALRARGHEVTLAAPPDQQGVADHYAVPFVACGRDVTAWVAGLDVTNTSTSATLRELKNHFGAEVAAQLPILVELARGGGSGVPVDVVVGAALTPWVETVCELSGAVGAYAYYSPGLVRSRRYTPVGIPLQGLPGPINLALYTLGLRFIDSTLVPLLTGPRAAFGLPPATRFAGTLADDVLFCWDPALADLPDDFVPWLQTRGRTCRAHAVGSLQPARIGQDGHLDDEVRAFVAPGNAVYVGFGSIPQRSFEALLTLVQDACTRAQCSDRLRKTYRGWGRWLLPRSSTAERDRGLEADGYPILRVLNDGEAVRTSILEQVADSC